MPFLSPHSNFKITLALKCMILYEIQQGLAIIVFSRKLVFNVVLYYLKLADLYSRASCGNAVSQANRKMCKVCLYNNSSLGLALNWFKIDIYM